MTLEYKAFLWFVEKMGTEQWNGRREKVINYLKDIDASLYQLDHGTDGKIKPIAVYDDWMAWYLFLVETASTYPWPADHIQLARIKPFFNAIGRGLLYLERMTGIEERVQTMLSKNRNQPDASLFELVVALTYHKNGWTVSFLEESKTGRMPDLLAKKSGKSIYVECKRLAKVNNYAEAERQAWVKRWLAAGLAIAKARVPVSVHVRFDVPIEEVPENALAEAFESYFKSPHLVWKEERAFTGFRMTVTPIHLPSVNASLNEAPAKHSSPALLNALLGKFDPLGNYTCLLLPHELGHFGETDIEILLSKCILSLQFAAVGSWESLSVAAIDQKAKDIKKLLSKAVSQIPEGALGAIHVGYETVLGPEVEQIRHEKIQETVYSFYYEDKAINAIYCHAIQPLATLEGFECAETISFFIKDSTYVLEDKLVLDPPGLETRPTTHWEEDLIRKKNG
ncbi:MAG TPA: hypothetical protein VMR70_01070 [Flavisolibacter sp.]|nr:hypothetical protein [Flavisolibacter sp.]